MFPDKYLPLGIDTKSKVGLRESSSILCQTLMSICYFIALTLQCFDLGLLSVFKYQQSIINQV